MSPISVHLICNAHLDPVWQWRWDEGASEALATFRNAVDILDEHPSLVFCHNEAVLYQWAERLDPALFAAIRRHVEAGRWAISGGWFIQPDVNLPGHGVARPDDRRGPALFPRALRRRAARRLQLRLLRPQRRPAPDPAPGRLRDVHPHAAPGRRARAAGRPLPLARRRRHGRSRPTGSPSASTTPSTTTSRSGCAQASRWPSSSAATCPSSGASATTAAGRRAATSSAIDAFIAGETRVRIVHSTPDRFYEAVKDAAAVAPVVEGDLQRVFTGCYTSLSRLKRRAVASLGRARPGRSRSRRPPGGGPDAPVPEAELVRSLEAPPIQRLPRHPGRAPASSRPSGTRSTCTAGPRTVGRNIALESLAALNRGSRNAPRSRSPSSTPTRPFAASRSNSNAWPTTARSGRANGACGSSGPTAARSPARKNSPSRSSRSTTGAAASAFVDDLPGVGVSRYLRQGLRDRRSPEA